MQAIFLVYRYAPEYDKKPHSPATDSNENIAKLHRLNVSEPDIIQLEISNRLDEFCASSMRN